MTLAQMALELDVSVNTAARVVRKYEWIGLAPHTENGITTYDAKAFERLKAIKSIPHRAGRDWLADYLGERHA